ncbi:hypothetical protein AKO1_011372 [Acrasis kona]|uniref:DUF7642 domain-containing protein n=1 Tax=Acrasis kona TaxID=1008807 RepID=A0AAW2YYZ4_9EUKA
MNNKTYKKMVDVSKLVEARYEHSKVNVPLESAQTLVQLLPAFVVSNIALLITVFLLIPTTIGYFFLKKKKLYVTENEIVSEVIYPQLFFFLYKKEITKINLAQVADVLLTQSWIQRILGLHDLYIRNSGHFGDFRTSTVDAFNISNGEELQELILERSRLLN